MKRVTTSLKCTVCGCDKRILCTRCVKGECRKCGR